MDWTKDLDDMTRLWEWRDRQEDELERDRVRALARAQQGAPEGWRHVETLNPCQEAKKEKVTIRVDEDVMAWFRGQGRGHQTRINQVLRLYMLMKRVEVV
ncbi:MAG: BrnA antitoxin family protein [Pseudomonadota bacterium]